MKNENTKLLSIPIRILYFIIGLTILTFLAVYSFQWDKLPFGVTFFGNTISQYVFPAMFVLVSIIAGALLMSSFDGKWRLR